MTDCNCTSPWEVKLPRLRTALFGIRITRYVKCRQLQCINKRKNLRLSKEKREGNLFLDFFFKASYNNNSHCCHQSLVRAHKHYMFIGTCTFRCLEHQHCVPVHPTPTVSVYLPNPQPLPNSAVLVLTAYVQHQHTCLTGTAHLWVPQIPAWTLGLLLAAACSLRFAK